MKNIVEDGIKRLYGLYRAVVVDNADPLKQRRLKLSIQTAPDSITYWVFPFESNNITAEVPEIGQGVWVNYINGDPEYPVWLGHFGKNKGKNKRIYIKPLSDSTSLTGITSYIILKTQDDGTNEVDLVQTLLAMANKLKDHETRITTLESTVSTLRTTLATRNAINHTHTNNG